MKIENRDMNIRNISTGLDYLIREKNKNVGCSMERERRGIRRGSVDQLHGTHAQTLTKLAETDNDGGTSPP